MESLETTEKEKTQKRRAKQIAEEHKKMDKIEEDLDQIKISLTMVREQIEDQIWERKHPEKLKRNADVRKEQNQTSKKMKVKK
jgi:hypothetical protein